MISISYFQARPSTGGDEKNVILLQANSNANFVGIDSSNQRFFPNKFYILIDGTIEAYSNDKKVFETSVNYDSTLQDYKDVWVYDTSYDYVKIDHNGKFIVIEPQAPSICKVLKLENSSFTIETTSNSSILIVGENSSNLQNCVAGLKSANTSAYHYNCEGPGTQVISTNSTCHIIYIEPK